VAYLTGRVPALVPTTSGRSTASSTCSPADVTTPSSPTRCVPSQSSTSTVTAISVVARFIRMLRFSLIYRVVIMSYRTPRRVFLLWFCTFVFLYSTVYNDNHEKVLLALKSH